MMVSCDSKSAKIADRQETAVPRPSCTASPRRRRRGMTQEGWLRGLLLSVCLGLSIGIASNARADFFDDIADWGNKVYNDLEGAYHEVNGWIKGAGSWASRTVKAVGKFTEKTFNEAAEIVEEGIDKAAQAMTEAASVFASGSIEAYLESTAEKQIGDMKDTLTKLAALIISVEEDTDTAQIYWDLAIAIAQGNGPAILDAVNWLLQEMNASNADATVFDAIIEDFQEKGLGSMLLVLSAGGGLVLTGESDTGVAVDVDWIAKWTIPH